MTGRIKELSDRKTNRRTFLAASAIAGGTVALALPEQSRSGPEISSFQTSAGSREKIREVRAYTAPFPSRESRSRRSGGGGWSSTMLVAAPMSVYPEYHDSRESWGIGMPGGILVEIEDEAGRKGYGTSSCGVPGAFIVENHFSRFLVGQHPASIEKLWDQMWRSSMHYGRKGLAVMAISAVDLALWDLLGKQRQEPVYALIGGPVKDYITMYGTTPKPAFAKSLGFWGAKMALPHGPADGLEGLRANVRMAEEARETVGDDFELMFDCWMALDVPYTIDLARALEPVRIKWLEEFLPPDNYDGLADVRQSVRSCWLTTGEHEYTRYGFLEILKRKAIDVIQPDIAWCGGLSEAIKIADLAKSFGVHIVPHGGSIYSRHFVISQTQAPFMEYFIGGPTGDSIGEEPLLADGKLKVSEEPGWGEKIDPSGRFRPFGE